MENDRSHGDGHSKNRQSFSEEGYSNTPKYTDDRVSNPRSQREK